MKPSKYCSQFYKQTILQLLVISFTLLSLLFTAPIYAIVFPVDATYDASDADINDNICDDGTGNCTLRAAIEQANNLAGTDTIDLPAGTYVLTIGDLDLNSDIYISGKGETVTIVDGNHNSRVFLVANGNTVKIDSMKLQNGYETLAGGGAIQNEGTLTVEDCTFFADTSKIGGAIYNLATGDMTISRCTIKNNAKLVSGWGQGGGIHNRGILHISDSEITENSSGNGGGIYNTSAVNLTIHNSVISDNTVKGTVNGTLAFGGGIYNGNSPINIYDSEISGNHAQSVYNQRTLGGGIHMVHNNVGNRTDTIINTIIKENTAVSVNSWAAGGGIYFDVNNAQVTLLLDKVIVQGNSASNTSGNSGYGGGIICTRSSSVIKIFNSLITGNLASGGSNSYGGGIRHRDGDMDILNSTISGNYAREGGGIYYHSGTMTLGNTIIAGNDASSMGPDFYEALAPTTNGGNLIGDNSFAPSFPSGSPNANNDYAGTGESPIDPLFELAVDPANAPDAGGDFHLQNGSIAIDNGVDALVIGILTTDIEGNDRRLDGDGDNTIQVDIGAYEFLFGPLPVELLEFNAACNYDFVHISWTTASETNNQYFFLERGVEGQYWTKIGEIESKGSNWLENTYTFDDFLTPTFKGQPIYYRLSQVDHDGNSTVLELQAVICGESNTIYKVWPNPTSGHLTLEMNLSRRSNINIHLSNITGRVIKTVDLTNIETQSSWQYDLSNLPDGVYLLTVQNGTDRQSFRIIKSQN